MLYRGRKLPGTVKRIYSTVQSADEPESAHPMYEVQCDQDPKGTLTPVEFNDLTIISSPIVISDVSSHSEVEEVRFAQQAIESFDRRAPGPIDLTNSCADLIDSTDGGGGKYVASAAA